jgi:DNA repair photolyase
MDELNNITSDLTNISNILPFPAKSFETTRNLRKLTHSKNEYGPIELKMRLMLDALKDTKYNDTFDWSVYDRISARFGDKQPRGGVVFNTTLKLLNHHSTCTKCHYSFEIDSYGRGCVHNCLYCYAKESLYAHKYWNEPMPFPVNLAEVRKIFYTVFETNRRSKWRDILEQRIPLRIGSMSDSFMWIDRKYGVTKELLNILNHYKYPHVVFTRSDLIAEDEYLRLLDPKLCAVQFSISGGNEKITKLIEPGAPPVKRRLNALATLASAGVWTTVRINPLFPIHPDGYYTDPFYVKKRFGSLEAAPKFDLFDWDFISELANAKVPSLVVGFVRLSTWSINNITKATGVNFKDFFKPELFKGNEDRKYTDSEIAFYYKKIQSLAVKNGIRFNSCYIGNGIKDYFQYQDLWSNKQDCCDVKGKVATFEKSAQDISWDVRLKHTLDQKSGLASMEADQNAHNIYSSVSAIPGLVIGDLKNIINIAEEKSNG